MKAYRINHTNPAVYCVEAYGVNHHPVFTNRKKAEQFLEKCAKAWPAMSPNREMYGIRLFFSVEAAMADGHAVLM